MDEQNKTTSSRPKISFSTTLQDGTVKSVELPAPSSIEERRYAALIQGDLPTEQEVASLMLGMFTDPEVKIEYYTEYGHPFDQALKQAIDGGDILVIKTENYYYKNPRHKRLFLLVPPDHPEESELPEWKKKLAETGPSFTKCTLSLSTKKIREYEIQQMQRSSKKPIDTWLSLLGCAMGIILFLIPKAPIVIVISLITIFLLLLHPLWNFWWIDKTKTRRLVSSTCFACLLVVLGCFVWPTSPSQTDSNIDQKSAPNDTQGIQLKETETFEKHPSATKSVTEPINRASESRKEKENKGKISFSAQQTPPLPLSPPKENPAVVALRFVYPKSPALIVENTGDYVARDIKWTVALWNMDLPDRNDPLPIPVQTFDWLKGHDEGGPTNLFGSPSVAPLLKPGNRLFGSASIDCPTCARGKTYIVYIVWGQGGWFSEVDNDTSGRVIVPVSGLKDSREKYFKALESGIPEKSRVPIGER